MKPPRRELFSKTLFQQRAIMVAIDEAHCIYEWLEHAYFIALIIRVTCATLHCAGDLTSGWHSTRLVPHENSIHVPNCFSFSSNRVRDCRLSRAYKPHFCEEPHQQSQYLLLCHKGVKYESKYMYNSSQAVYLYIFVFVFCRKILVTLPCALKNPHRKKLVCYLGETGVPNKHRVCYCISLTH